MSSVATIPTAAATIAAASAVATTASAAISATTTIAIAAAATTTVAASITIILTRTLFVPFRHWKKRFAREREFPVRLHSNKLHIKDIADLDDVRDILDTLVVDLRNVE